MAKEEKDGHGRRRRTSHFDADAPPVKLSRGRRWEPGPSDDLVDAFVVRTTRALKLIAERMTQERLVAAVGAPTDADALFMSLRESVAIAAEIELDKPDPMTEAYLRESERKREMLKAEGGALTAFELSKHLGITPQGLGRKRFRNQVFWLGIGEGYVFPAFQIGENGLRHGTRDVLDAFALEDPWMRVKFMLGANRRLGGKRPLDLYRKGEIDEVVKAAAAYGEDDDV